MISTVYSRPLTRSLGTFQVKEPVLSMLAGGTHVSSAVTFSEMDT